MALVIPCKPNDKHCCSSNCFMFRNRSFFKYAGNRQIRKQLKEAYNNEDKTAGRVVANMRTGIRKQRAVVLYNQYTHLYLCARTIWTMMQGPSYPNPSLPLSSRTLALSPADQPEPLNDIDHLLAGNGGHQNSKFMSNRTSSKWSNLIDDKTWTKVAVVHPGWSLRRSFKFLKGGIFSCRVRLAGHWL